MLVPLAVGAVCGTLFISIFGLSVTTIMGTLLMAYLPSYMDGSEYTGARYWDWFATHPTWKYLFSYFPAKMVYTTPIDPNKRYIFGSHPHGVLSISHLLFMCDGCGFHDVSPGKTRRDVAAGVVFMIPVFRELCLWLGCVHASASTARRMLNQQRSLLTLPGGMNEQIIAKPGDHTVYIRKRKGFIALALRSGIPLVPIYVFGENDIYNTSTSLYSFRLWILRVLRVALPIPLHILPLRTPLVACVGIPLSVEQTTAEPTEEEINTLHTAYITALQQVFDKNKANNGYPNSTLNII